MSYDRRAGTIQDGADWCESEVLKQRFKGKLIQEELSRYLVEFLTQSQAMHQFLVAASKEAKETVQGGDKITSHDMYLALLRGVVGNRLGDDPLAKAIARALATGDYIF